MNLRSLSLVLALAVCQLSAASAQRASSSSPRVPAALRPSAPPGTRTAAGAAAPATTSRPPSREADTSAIRVQRAELAPPAAFAIPGVVFAGDASLHARGLGGPTRSGISAMIPLAFVLGHFTPYLSLGAVGWRWLPDSLIVTPTDSLARPPLLYQRRSLSEQLSDSTVTPFIGAGVGVKAGAVGVSGEVRKVKGKGIEQQVRGKVKF